MNLPSPPGAFSRDRTGKPRFPVQSRTNRRPRRQPKETTMKKLILTTAALMLATPVLAETPNRTTMSFEEYLNASGCVLVDMGGYQNIAATDGGNCSAAVVASFTVPGSRVEAGADGILGTADDRTVTDN
jgi:hypothetical protein